MLQSAARTDPFAPPAPAQLDHISSVLQCLGSEPGPLVWLSQGFGSSITMRFQVPLKLSLCLPEVHRLMLNRFVQNKLVVAMIQLSISFYILYEQYPGSNFIFCCVVELKGNDSLSKMYFK